MTYFLIYKNEKANYYDSFRVKIDANNLDFNDVSFTVYHSNDFIRYLFKSLGEFRNSITFIGIEKPCFEVIYEKEAAICTL